MISIKPKITNEYTKLKLVVLGTHQKFETLNSTENGYDPVSKYFVRQGLYPSQEQIATSLDEIGKVFQKYGVEVLRPKPEHIGNYVFSRDVTFVVEDKLFISNMIVEREDELHALDDVFNRISPEQIVSVDPQIRFEGGDVMVHNEYIFVGYADQEDFLNYKTSRTNKAGVDFLARQFPQKTVIGFELYKDDDDHIQNVLHLDCCMQPVGAGEYLLINPKGFKNQADVEKLYSIFSKDKCIEVSAEEGSLLMTNLLSISPRVVISDKRFDRVNMELRDRGIVVEEVDYESISRMGGLFRCTTMPIIREE